MQVYKEITPLKSPDIFVVIDSVCNGFDYPVHNHPEYEINLVTGISGSRIVGDSIERYHDFDLVLLGPYLYHKWDGDEHLQRSGQPYRVITIQFAMDLFSSGQLFQKERFANIRKLLKDAGRGIQFQGKTLQEAMQRMVRLTEDKGFANVIEFLQLLDLLSLSTETNFLASEGFSPRKQQYENNRIQIAYSYMLKNFADPGLRLGDVAAKVNMSESAFSHYFQKVAFRSFTQFLLDVRIGHACRLLLNTDETVSQICFQSGFNNLANFNRLFKKYRLCTPVEYRKRYFEKDQFDWTKQVTPWQFLPSQAREHIQPATYATRLVHL